MPKIVVLDTETQGLDPEHKVCELGWTVVTNEGDGWKVGETGSRLCAVDHMPPQARAVHHISAEDTAGYPPHDPGKMWDWLEEIDADVVAAHYLAFDLQHFGEPRKPLICTYKAALRVWPEAPSHGNGPLRYWLQDQDLITPDPALCVPAHRAGPDTYVTAHLLIAMLAKATAADMVRWQKEPPLQPTCMLGDWRGKPWPEVDAGFLRWIVNKPGMDPDHAWNARRELDRRAA